MPDYATVIAQPAIQSATEAAQATMQSQNNEVRTAGVDFQERLNTVTQNRNG